VLKKIVAVAALTAGLSWAAPALADTDAGVKANVQTEVDADVKAVLDAFPGATVRTYDLSKKGDLCSLLSSLLFGFDASMDTKVAVDSGVKVGR